MSTDTHDDETFLADFLAARLDGAAFGHHGHLRAAWLLLQRQPLQQAVQLSCDGIRRLAERFGAAAKFHHTRTEALMRLMAHGGAADRRLPWPAFLRDNAALVADARGLLAQHYTPECLDSPAARVHFVPPDLKPLPP